MGGGGVNLQLPPLTPKTPDLRQFPLNMTLVPPIAGGAVPGYSSGRGGFIVVVTAIAVFSIDLVGDTVQLAKMARTSIDRVKDKIRTLPTVSSVCCLECSLLSVCCVFSLKGCSLSVSCPLSRLP